jgi:hypothetical protein
MKRKGKDSKADIVKTTIRVKRELWNAILHRSIDDNLTSQTIVERALELYLKQKGSRK